MKKKHMRFTNRNECKSNEYRTNKDIFNKIEEVVILSESQCSSDLSYKQGFSTLLLDIYTLFKVSGDGN